MQNLNIWLRRLLVAVLTVAFIALALHALETAARHLGMDRLAAFDQWLDGIIHAHQEVLVIFAMAVIAVLPEDLPSPFDLVPLFVWMWKILVQSLKLFVSMQRPNTVVSHVEQHDSPGGSSKVTDKTVIPSPAAKEDAK